MSARLLTAADTALIISALRTSAEIYLRDALVERAHGRAPREVNAWLEKGHQALRIADELEAGGDMPCFLRRQAD